MAVVEWRFAVGPALELAATVWTMTPSAPGPGAIITRFLSNPTVTWRLGGPAELAIVVDASDVSAAIIKDLETDLWAWRNGILVFRGRIMAVEDDVLASDGQGRGRLSFVARDYSEVLRGRTLLGYNFLAAGFLTVYEKLSVYGAVNSLTTADQAEHLLRIVDWAQDTNNTSGSTRNNAWLGIVKGWSGTTPTGVNRTFATMSARTGQNAGDALDTVAGLTGGCDWWIDHDLKLQVGYPYRGSGTASAPAKLLVGLNVDRVTRTFRPDRYANQAGVWGAFAPGGPDLLETEVLVDVDGTRYYGPDGHLTVGHTPDYLTTLRGRWTRAMTFPSEPVSSVALNLAQGAINRWGLSAHAWKISVRPGEWLGPTGGHQVGDVVVVAVNRPPRFPAVSKTGRVVSVAVEIDIGARVETAVLDVEET